MRKLSQRFGVDKDAEAATLSVTGRWSLGGSELPNTILIRALGHGLRLRRCVSHYDVALKDVPRVESDGTVYFKGSAVLERRDAGREFFFELIEELVMVCVQIDGWRSVAGRVGEMQAPIF